MTVNIKKWIKAYKESILQDKMAPELSGEYKIMPFVEAFRIAFLYGLLGVAWVAFPDPIISRLVNVDNYMTISIYKGWAYVALSVVLVFLLVHKRLLLYKRAVRRADESYQKEKEIENELYSIAYYDTLTDLPNRRMFEEWLPDMLQMRSGQKHGILYMDIDDFKNINDSKGHIAGDAYLESIANVLSAQMSDHVFVARLGGDEFAVVLIGVESRDEVVEKTKELISFAKEPWVYQGQEFYGSVSIGIAMYPEDGTNMSNLLRNADIAMYQVKNDSKNNYQFFTEELKEANLRKITMVNDLHRALENQEFELFYQPILDLEDYRLIGVEALIRWNHPLKGLVSPLDFIPVAEESGLIHSIGDWVMKTAISQKARWEAMGLIHLKMSINISGQSLIQPGFIKKVEQLLRSFPVNPSEIQMEITETALIRSMKNSVKVLNTLREMGILIALDDFGTGYSSLTYLKNLPIDVVKLDGTFVKDILQSGRNSMIVESVIRLTNDLDLKIVAEGIENEQQLNILKDNECTYGQGYLFSKPVKSQELEQLMESMNPQINRLGN